MIGDEIPAGPVSYQTRCEVAFNSFRLGGFGPPTESARRMIVYLVSAKDVRIAELEAERDELLEFASQVLNWSEAYPERIFTEPTQEQVAAACESLGCSIDRISAMVLRCFTKPWGDIARSALLRTKKADR